MGNIGGAREPGRQINFLVSSSVMCAVDSVWGLPTVLSPPPGCGSGHHIGGPCTGIRKSLRSYFHEEIFSNKTMLDDSLLWEQEWLGSKVGQEVFPLGGSEQLLAN